MQSPFQPPSAPPLPDPTGAPPPQPPPGYAPPAGTQYAAPHDPTGGLIPLKNPNALASYYIGIISMLPPLGFVLGPLALWFGFKALKFYRAQPFIRGRTHAWVGILCAAFATLLHFGFGLLFLFAR